MTQTQPQPTTRRRARIVLRASSTNIDARATGPHVVQLRAANGALLAEDVYSTRANAQRGATALETACRDVAAQTHPQTIYPPA